MCRSGAGSWDAATRPGIPTRACSARRHRATGTASFAPWKPKLFRVDPDQIVEIIARFIQYGCADALVQSVEAAAVRVQEHAGEAIGGNSGRIHEGSIGG